MHKMLAVNLVYSKMSFPPRNAVKQHNTSFEMCWKWNRWEFVLLSDKRCTYTTIQKFQQQLFSTLIIRNYSCAVNQHIMISEGSCDTEDWSNDTENSALPTQY